MNQSSAIQRLTQGQLALLRRLPAEPAVPVAPVRLTVPAKEYTDPKRFDLEREAIFFGGPIIAAASASLPDRGSYCRLDILEKPVVLTRDRDGAVSAFLNVCSHRGAVLCPNHEPAAGNLMVCPYHAWSFDLKGQLVGVPRQEIFDNLDKAKHALKPLPCGEEGGLIWIGLREDSFDDVQLGRLGSDLSALRLDAARLFKKARYEVRANWKLVMDSMLDTYHVVRLHKKTLARFFVDSPTVAEQMGPHLVSAGARANYDGNALKDDLDVVRQMAVLTYNIFPNGIVVLSPDYISVAILYPRTFDRTDVDYLMLSGNAPLGAAEKEKLERSFALMDIAFGNEDFWAAELGQQGLAAGAIEELTLGGMETQMKLFHDVVNEQLARWHNK